MAVEEHARVARALGAGSPRPTLEAGARVLTAEDAYNFDCAGFLHVRQLLSSSELSDVAAALSTGADTAPLLTEHPVLRGYLSQLFWSEETGDLRSGPQIQLELPPVLLPPLSRGQPLPPLVGGTAEDGSIDTSRSYFHEAGHRFCHGVKVIWALADEGCQLPEGGYVVIPGSHKSTIGTPPAIRDGTADAELLSLGLLQRPDMAAGDVLFVASGLLQGPRPWAGGEGRLVLAEFIAGQARSLRDRADTLEDIAAGLQLEQDGASWLNSLGPRERAVFTGQVRGYFLVFVQLFEKYGNLIERYTALNEEVSALIGSLESKPSPLDVRPISSGIGTDAARVLSLGSVRIHHSPISLPCLSGHHRL
eukprot:SAG31_NODE_39_length_31377_cov_5.971482_8_plen_364_part_00